MAAKKQSSGDVSSYLSKMKVETRRRSDIMNAPYNPRFIEPENRKKLRKAINEYGLVNTIVVNDRTGNLVGGHQRLSVLDELEGSLDYEVTVSVISVDETKEKQLNLFLNNPASQGAWDFDGMVALLKDEQFGKNGYIESGFNAADIKQTFGRVAPELFDAETELKKATINKPTPAMPQQVPVDKDFSDGGVDDDDEAEPQTFDERVKEATPAVAAASQSPEKANAEVIMVFENRAHCDVFLSHFNMNLQERNQDGRRLAGEMGLEL